MLLRESYRDEQGRSQKRTLANLSKLPRDMIDTLKAVLKGGTVVGTGPQELEVERSLPHGHVAAALGMIRKIGLDRLILSAAKDPASRRCCDLVVAMMVDRLIAPRSKLGFVRAVDEETAISSSGAVLHLGRVKEREAYEALDWLLERQARIENGLARRHLEDGVLVLYDVSSSYFEGRCCPLARYGHSRDHRKDRLQIVYGLLCTREGLPIAVEVFDGNTADPSTLSAQIEKVKDRFGISRLVLVGDRGMITSARIRDELRPANLDWITCLRASAVQALAAENGPLQLSLFDDRDLAEISAPISRSPGNRSGALISARSRSSNNDSCNGPFSAASACTAGARRQVIQSRFAGLSSSRMRAEVIMPRSPTSTRRLMPKRSFTFSICALKVDGSAVLPSNTSTAIGSPSRVQSSP